MMRLLNPEAHEAYVRERFNLVHARFKNGVAPDDFRLTAIVRALGSVEGLRILDLGSGKGRFARRLAERGAEVVALDPAMAMLAEARVSHRVCGSGRRLPFARGAFDAAIAVEVFQHLGDVSPTLRELRRVLRPGGRLVVVDRNALAMDPHRPWMPSLVVKRIDELRGRWMYPVKAPVRERWFHPPGLAREIRRSFLEVRVTFALSDRERGCRLARRIPWVRQFGVWVASAPGGRHDT